MSVFGVPGDATGTKPNGRCHREGRQRGIHRGGELALPRYGRHIVSGADAGDVCRARCLHSAAFRTRVARFFLMQRRSGSERWCRRSQSAACHRRLARHPLERLGQRLESGSGSPPGATAPEQRRERNDSPRCASYRCPPPLRPPPPMWALPPRNATVTVAVTSRFRCADGRLAPWGGAAGIASPLWSPSDTVVESEKQWAAHPGAFVGGP